MNNDDQEKSSRVNTTPFKNRNNNNSSNLNNILNNYNRHNINRSSPRNVTNNINDSSNELNNNEGKSNKRIPNKKNNSLGQTANNLRNKFNTVPTNLDDAKKEAVKKGAEALKKSANPYAKAAGLAMGAIEKQKEKKEKQQEESEQNEDNINLLDEEGSYEDEQEGKLKVKKILPILMIALPLFMTIFIVIYVISIPSNMLSWFTSLFYHNKEEAAEYTIYDEDEEESKEEQAFNDAILGSSDGSVKGIVQKYQEKYGVTIDWYLLEAVLTYRYAAVDSDLMYSDDGNSEVGDDDVELETETEEEATETDSSQNGIDYTAAKKKIETVAKLMITKTGSTYTTDNKVGGEFYNKLIDSSFLKSYYKDMLKNNEYETRKELVDEIFEYSEAALEYHTDDGGTTNGGIISDTIQVHLQTCKQPYDYTTINGMRVWNNPSATGDYPVSLSLTDYLKGVLYGEIGGHLKDEYKESVKALIITAMSKIISRKQSGFDLKNGNVYVPSGNCFDLCCDPNNGCTYRYEGQYGTTYTGPNRFSTYKFVRDPIDSERSQYVDELLNEVFGYVMVKKGVTPSTFVGSSSVPGYAGYFLSKCSPGTCLSQNDSFNDALNGMSYVDILNKYYYKLDNGSGFDLINIKEGLYYQSTGDYSGTATGLNESYHYHQSDSEWATLNLCGSGAISSNGCNITSAAIAISILKNERITPAVLQGRQGSISMCSPNSRPEMIMNFAKLYGLSAQEVKASNQGQIKDMLEKLATGNYTAVARIKPNSGVYKTSNGHYVTVVGVKTEEGVNKLLIWDPGNKSSSRDNAWIDVNYLVKYLQPNYSFILIGK